MKKTIVAVIVYDRFDNIREWVRCWNMCEHYGAELVVIHNFDSQEAKEAYSKFCLESGIHYVPRENVGFDIGAFQDVCRGRLAGFPDGWDYIIWCTDDTIPMRRDFVLSFLKPFESNPKLGLTCMEMSKQVRMHVRTTGFCISRHTASQIKFPADPITTKAQCYDFEHRVPGKILYNQITLMGLQCLQITNVKQSPLWDTGRHPSALLDRKKEHFTMFPTNKQSSKKVTVICLAYNSYPEIVGSMINQTHQEWELIIIHDGPAKVPIKKWVESAGDSRIKLIETPERKGEWGHYWRQWALNGLKVNKLGSPSDYVVITNADNHHVPTYLEYMVDAFEKNPDAIAVYCEKMLHSYIEWGVIECRPQQGYMDCAGVMVRREVACEIGWNDVKSHSADWLYFADILKKYGMKSFVKVKGCLLIHN